MYQFLDFPRNCMLVKSPCEKIQFASQFKYSRSIIMPYIINRFIFPVRSFRKISKNVTSQFLDSPPVTDQCLPEFSRVGSWRSCYRFSLFNATWHEAREYCSAFGANLLAVDSLKEAHIVDYLIKSHSG